MLWCIKSLFSHDDATEKKLDAIFDDLMSRPTRETVESGDDVVHYTHQGVPLPLGLRMETDAEFRARIKARRG